MAKFMGIKGTPPKATPPISSRPEKGTINHWFSLIRFWNMSSVQNPGWLGYIRDYTTQLYRDYNKPLQGFLSTNQDSMECQQGFERCRCPHAIDGSYLDVPERKLGSKVIGSVGYFSPSNTPFTSRWNNPIKRGMWVNMFFLNATSLVHPTGGRRCDWRADVHRRDEEIGSLLAWRLLTLLRNLFKAD